MAILAQSSTIQELRGQSLRPFAVRLTVRDSAGHPVAHASAAVVRGLNELIGTASTDSTGAARIGVSNAPAALQIVVRHLGFAPDARFVSTTGIDSAILDIRLARAPVALDSVRISAAESATRKSYYIDHLGQWQAHQTCRVIAVGHVPHIGEVFVRKEIVDILEEIRPEHIEEIRYTDCFDTSVPGLGTRSAAFVILKTGIGYERGKGSFVVKPDSSGQSH